MNDLKFIDYMFLFSLISIWILLLYNIVLTFSGYIYYIKVSKFKTNAIKEMSYFPTVSILIPAHNEEKVIEKTMKSIMKLDYPQDKLEIIVINDNSSDRTGKILRKIRDENLNINLKIITTDSSNGGKGKSNALNIGYKGSKGEFIVIYDADNTPEAISLRYLVYTILSSDRYAAVIGKFRTRNKSRNLLTKFINIEGISFQWMAQGGRWQLFKICTIPGTNFIIRRSIIEDLNGWDTDAISEDTEISIRIYRMGYKICFMPLAVTWEQEPETLKIWIKQRTRWAKGNIYVVFKYLMKSFSFKAKGIMVDIFYFFSVYFLFLSAVLISDGIFILGLFTQIKISLPGNFTIIWVLAYILFILEVSIALTMERGESNVENILIVALMYFTYCQLWIFICVRGIILYTRDKILKRENKWYKTERFE